jgi:hypothetical protein
MPKVVFWNVRGNTDNVPVTGDQRGVIMLSGFAKSQMTMIFEGDEIRPPTPYEIMMTALSDPRYDVLMLAPEPDPQVPVVSEP